MIKIRAYRDSQGLAIRIVHEYNEVNLKYLLEAGDPLTLLRDCLSTLDIESYHNSIDKKNYMLSLRPSGYDEWELVDLILRILKSLEPDKSQLIHSAQVEPEVWTIS